MWIYIEDSLSTLCSCISPVVFISGTVPLCCVLAFLTFAVRLVLEIISDKCIVVLVFVGKPYKRIDPYFCGYTSLAVPEVVVVT